MDTLQAIKTRRSIRHYQSTPVSAEIEETLLRAAMQAPSAGNGQPWHFVVIRDRELLKAVPTFHPYGQMVPESALTILVCAEPKASKFGDYFPQDCSAAVENILLTAHSLGLGAVWVGMYPRQERMQAIQKMIKLPEGIIPFALIPIGFPAEEVPPTDRYQADRVHHDQW